MLLRILFKGTKKISSNVLWVSGSFFCTSLLHLALSNVPPILSKHLFGFIIATAKILFGCRLSAPQKVQVTTSCLVQTLSLNQNILLRCVDLHGPDHLVRTKGELGAKVGLSIALLGFVMPLVSILISKQLFDRHLG